MAVARALRVLGVAGDRTLVMSDVVDLRVGSAVTPINPATSVLC
jgi:hypothetical protein